MLHEQELRIQELRIEGIRIRIAHARERLERLREDLEQVRITAPTDGLFLVIQKYSWGARRWEPLGVGTQIYGMNLIGHIVDPSRLHLRVLIHESDREAVVEGRPVSVQLTAFPDLTVPGRVKSITGIGQDRDDLSPVHQQASPVNQALFLAIVEVELPDDLDMKPGMTAQVTFPAEASE
jgi:multidrug resistance efflux pump